MVTQLRHKFFAVVALVRSQRDAMPARDSCHHRYGRLRLRTAGGRGHAAVGRDAVAVLHQHVAGVAELGLLARALAGQAGVRIGGRLVGEVAAPLAVKVDAGIAGIVRQGVPVRIIFALEALVSRPRFEKCPVDREMLVREQTMRTGLVNHHGEKTRRHFAFKQPLAVLGEHGRAPHGIVDARPTKQRNWKL